MDREKAEQVTTAYLKPIYGFALKRCARLQDAEDLAQEIVLRAFQALLVREDIAAPEKFIWTIAHNTLANYYRSKAKYTIGTPIDTLAATLSAEDDTAVSIIEKESVNRLHQEIAYLSKLQRRIVIAFYYENRKLNAIADELSLPLGTVKWHLFEAKKDLKKGMDTMRHISELKFDPIRFDLCETNGSLGTKGANRNFFHSALPQNIVYAVWRGAKTINEIADRLGVSPVYVESEAEYLTEYGFLLESKGTYQCNLLLDEPTDQTVQLHDEMYAKAAQLFANELFDELTACGILQDERILCGQTDQPLPLEKAPRADDSFLLWSLIPYIAALSGEHLMNRTITFDEAATIRPDGGHNICCVSIADPDMPKPLYHESMQQWSGPCWNGSKDYILWQIDSEWSAKRIDDHYSEKAGHILSLYAKSQNAVLSEEECAFLAEAGMVKVCDDGHGGFKPLWQIVRLKDKEIAKQLIAIGDRVKAKHWTRLEALRAPFVQAVLEGTPKHLRKMQQYSLQFTFSSDRWFILHCLKVLVNSGKLRLPAEHQKQALSTIIVPQP